MASQGGNWFKFDNELSRVFGIINALLITLVDFRSGIEEEDDSGFRWAPLTVTTISKSWISGVEKKTLSRHLSELRKPDKYGYAILKSKEAHPYSNDKTNAYRVDYGAVCKLAPNSLLARSCSAAHFPGQSKENNEAFPYGQNAHVDEDNLSISNRQNARMDEDNLSPSILVKKPFNNYKEEEELSALYV